jgi:hypothetical protein
MLDIFAERVPQVEEKDFDGALEHELQLQSVGE